MKPTPDESQPVVIARKAPLKHVCGLTSFQSNQSGLEVWLDGLSFPMGYPIACYLRITVGEGSQLGDRRAAISLMLSEANSKKLVRTSTATVDLAEVERDGFEVLVWLRGDAYGKTLRPIKRSYECVIANAFPSENDELLGRRFELGAYTLGVAVRLANGVKLDIPPIDIKIVELKPADASRPFRPSDPRR